MFKLLTRRDCLPPLPPPFPSTAVALWTLRLRGVAVRGCRAEAAANCAESHEELCRKSDLAGYSGCEVGWCSDFEGYWMAHGSAGCGHAGYNERVNMTAGAWCCKPGS